MAMLHLYLNMVSKLLKLCARFHSHNIDPWIGNRHKPITDVANHWANGFYGFTKYLLLDYPSNCILRALGGELNSPCHVSCFP